MSHSPRTSCSLLLPFLLLAFGGGCDGGGTISAEERQALADFETAADDTVTSLDGLGDATATLVTRLEDGSSDAMVDAAINAQDQRLAELDRAIADLEDAEMLLQQPTYGGGNDPRFRRDPLAGVVLYVLAVTAFAATMHAFSNRMSAARTRRDTALATGDTAGYQAAQREMAMVGTEAAEKIVTKIIPNPVDRVISLIPVPGGDLSVLITARDAVDDVTTLVATEECRVDPDSDECKVGATTATSGTDLEVPAGTLQVAVTGAGLARTIVDGVEVPAGERVVLEIDPTAHADLPVEGMDDIQHCFGTFGCFDGTSDWLPTECASEGGTPMPGPCP